MTASKGYNLEVGRHEEQVNQMKDLIDRGICNFCREHIETEQKEPIELETKYWVVKKNDYPYKDTSLHLLLISKEHVNSLANLTEAARHDLTDVIVTVEKQWKLTSYVLGMRAGDMRFTGASVEHLHGHLVVGDTSNPNHEPIRFKMSSRPKS